MYSPEDLENTPFNWKIFSNFVAFSEYPNFMYNVSGFLKTNQQILKYTIGT